MLTNVTTEIALGATMLDGTPTWTDVSAYVRNTTVNRGRPTITGRFAAGTATLTLDNRDGRFNPENTAGAYYPDLQIGIPVRIYEDAEPIFYGSARAWPPAYPKTQDSFVTVPLVDGFYNLNLEDLGGDSYPAQSSTSRLTAVLDAISWPAGLRDLDTGLASIQAVDIAQPSDGGDQPALLHLLDVVEAEAGTLFMSRDGKVTFRNRIALSGISPAVSFADTELSGLTVAYDDDYLWNEFRIAREDGAQVIYVDTTSVAAHGRRALVRDVMPMSNDAEVLNLAEWLAAVFGAQRSRIEGLTLVMHDTAAHLDDVLGLELRDLINVTHVPPGGDTINVDCVIEGIRHVMVPGKWTTYLSVVPAAETETQDYWILDTSELEVSTRIA